MSTTNMARATSRGTKTTEIIIGAASSKLETGLKALIGVVDEVAKLDSKISENTLLISDLEDKIAAKEVELKNSIAQNKIELQQAYDSDRQGFVRAWVMEKGYEVVEAASLAQLKADLAAAKADTEAQIKAQVAIVTNTLNRNHESAKKEYELEFKAKEAQTAAALAQKDDKIKFLEDQVASWQKALNDEREAGVKRAQAGAIQTLNVGGNGNGR